uniref:Uncharacterized protein n=1 Tax=Anas platyrhynchos platyrhynchos TaxID=8840 RepID=A0A493TFC8_ANAPP
MKTSISMSTSSPLRPLPPARLREKLGLPGGGRWAALRSHREGRRAAAPRRLLPGQPGLVVAAAPAGRVPPAPPGRKEGANRDAPAPFLGAQTSLVPLAVLAAFPGWFSAAGSCAEGQTETLAPGAVRNPCLTPVQAAHLA